MKRRVVVTGMGAVTPLGNDVESFWQGVQEGRNGIGEITHFDISQQKCTMGAEIKDFLYHDKRSAKRLDRSSQYGLTAVLEAMKQSGLESGENVDPKRFGVLAGTGIGGITTLEEEVSKALEKGISRVSALLVPMVIPNILAGNIAIQVKANAACLGLVTACAAGTHAIGEAYRQIQHGYADVMVSGAAEAAFAPVCFSGFANMTALSTRKDPNRCSTPFDKERDGFVMGEGAGFLILEDYQHAKSRNAVIYGEVVGYGSTCDAYHLTSPAPDGEGAKDAMLLALQDAELGPQDIDYINAHGTGTPYNDLFETLAIKSVFGENTKVPISSTKSMTGHLLGAAGAVEGILCIKALLEGFIPPTINLKVPDPELDLDYTPNQGRNEKLSYVMSNSLGFGGHNGTLIFKKYEDVNYDYE